MTHMTNEEYLEVQHRMHILQESIDKSSESIDEPESKLASKIRRYCKNHGLPCLIFPQTQDVRNFLPKGWPDIEIVLRGKLPLYLELKKVKGGRKSKAQKDMALMFAYLGNPIYECRTYKRFLEVLYSKN